MGESKREPAYIALSRNGMDKLYGLNSSEMKMLCCLMKWGANSREYGGVICELTPRKKKKMLEFAGWERVSTIDTMLQRLLKRGVITRVDRGIYLLDTDVFMFRGGYPQKEGI